MNGGYGGGRRGGSGSGRPRGPGDPSGYGPPGGYGDQDSYDDPDSHDSPAGHGDQDYGDPAYGDRGRPRRPAGAQPPRRRGYGQPGMRPGTGPRPAQRGMGPAAQGPQDYDQGGTGPRPVAGGYPGGGGYPARGDARYGQEQGWDAESRDEAFLPGFEGRGLARGRGGPYADEGGAPDGYDNPRRDPRSGRGGGPGDWDDDTDWPPRRRGPIRRLAPWIALLVILTPLLIGGLYVYHLYENKYHPADYAGPGTGQVTVQVKSGDTAFTLGPELVQLGVVASARAFELAAESINTTSVTGLEVGFYKLKYHMEASLAYEALLNPKNRVQFTVLVPEGKRTSQVILLLSKATNVPLADFQQVIEHPAALGLPSYAHGKVEGYLFPATYTFQPDETALQMLQAMVQRYDLEAQQINLASAAKSVGLTPEQVIIEASMAQAEGGSVSDYPKIARVIINRLNDGMKLQFDSVLLYGLNAYAINVTQKQIDTPGPYNDFEHGGLPPTPICNPGDAAIQGILHPTPGDWLYFLTVTGGKSQFSATPLAGQ